MGHAAAAASRVVLAPAVAGPRQAVAREYEQVLEPLVALARRRHRRYRRSRLPVARREPAIRRQPVVAREVLNIDGYDQLGGGSRAYAGNREQASVGLVRRQQGRYRRGQSFYLGGVLRYPAREQPHRAVLARDGRGGRLRRRRHGIQQRRRFGAAALAGKGAYRPRRGGGHRPRPAQRGHERERGPVRQVGASLELGARFEQYAAQPVLRPRVLAGQEIPLRGELPRCLDFRRPLGHRQQRVGYAERGLRYHRRVALVGLGVAGEQLRRAVGRQARQVRPGHACRLRPRQRQRAYVAHLVDDDQRARILRIEPVDGVFPVQDRLACQKLALARDHARPVRRLPDVEPYDDSAWWVVPWWYPPIGRPIEALLDTHITWLRPRARQFPISRSERRASSVATPPGPSRGRGRRPSGDARSAAPRGLAKL